MTTTVQLKEKINLTDIELKIFDLLLLAARSFNPDTQLRVAGGWVRDKLLGKDSSDIDIAIDNMSGIEFVKELDQYLRSIGEVGHAIVIMKSKSKEKKDLETKQRVDLETAKMRLYNQWIDFVQLRCGEEYDENSRMPVNVKPGSPEEDAYRRDLTINSLFYNIHTGLVEDLTKRGIDDLKSGRIVTPLPAKYTFMEDPLRVLRAIRFGTRFGFTLDEELKEAASCEEVREALGRKISRERIGNEIDMMISGNRPVSAVTYLSDLKLFGVVFDLPSSSDPAPPENCGSVCRACMEAMWNLIQTPDLVNLSGEQKRLALYAALFLPFRKTVHVVNYIFKNSMKRKTRDAEKIINIHRDAERFLSLILPLQLKNKVELDKFEWTTDVVEHWESISLYDPELLTETSKLRVVTGLLLRDIKDLWRVALLASLLLYKDDDGVNLDFQLDKKREIYLTVQDTILELGLDTIWDMKPLMNGDEIIEEVQNGKTVIEKQDRGPIIRLWQRKMLIWQLTYLHDQKKQLTYPKGFKEEFKNWMIRNKGKTNKDVNVTLEYGLKIASIIKRPR